MKTLSSVLLIFFFLATTVWAGERQNHAQIKDIAFAYIQAQTLSLPGKVSIQMQDIDSRTSLAACVKLEAFMPSGSQLMGKSVIGVRCNEKPGWTIFVQANIRIAVDMLVANRPLAQNTVLSARDISLQQGEMTRPDILTDPAQAIGKILKFGIGAGQVLRLDMMRAPYVVEQGKSTEVRIHNAIFSVSASGQALNAATEGQSVQVRMASGQVISGIATSDGSVDVHP